jgi:hypothetical protein
LRLCVIVSKEEVSYASIIWHPARRVLSQLTDVVDDVVGQEALTAARVSRYPEERLLVRINPGSESLFRSDPVSRSCTKGLVMRVETPKQP